MKVILLLAIAIAAALVTQPVRATAINTLVITEFSSTSLTATLNNNPLNVTFNGADNWTIVLAVFGGQDWAEPGGAAGVANGVMGQGLLGISVISDSNVGVQGLADGTMDTTSFTLNRAELDVTFFDKGDVAAAPDTGSTLGLLSLSVVALFGATRLRFLQLAA